MQLFSHNNSPNALQMAATNTASTASTACDEQHAAGLFSKLSAELRNKIYELVLIGNQPIDLSTQSQPNLSGTCKLIRSECLPMYFGSNKFEYSTTSGGHSGFQGLMIWLKRIGRRNHSKMRSVRIVVRQGCMITSMDDANDAWTRMIPKLMRWGAPRVETVFPEDLQPPELELAMMYLEHGSRAAVESVVKERRDTIRHYCTGYANMTVLLTAKDSKGQDRMLGHFHKAGVSPKKLRSC